MPEALTVGALYTQRYLLQACGNYRNSPAHRTLCLLSCIKEVACPRLYIHKATNTFQALSLPVRPSLVISTGQASRGYLGEGPTKSVHKIPSGFIDQHTQIKYAMRCHHNVVMNIAGSN